jgi:D-glycero-D-manno-heptose 1,7-bisphosphate phosphatase
MQIKQKCIFLDRDGVLNEDLGTYLFRTEDIVIPEGVPQALQLFQSAGYLLIVITNQGGIAKKLYTKEEVVKVHKHLQQLMNIAFTDLYYSPYHQEITQSLSRKPDSLMLEKAVAKYTIDIENSWMIGDQVRDVIAGNKAGLRTVLLGQEDVNKVATLNTKTLLEAAQLIIKD